MSAYLLTERCLWKAHGTRLPAWGGVQKSLALLSLIGCQAVGRAVHNLHGALPCFAVLQAAMGIADLITKAMEKEDLPPEESLKKIWMVDSKGLIVKVSSMADLSVMIHADFLKKHCILKVLNEKHKTHSNTAREEQEPASFKNISKRHSTINHQITETDKRENEAGLGMWQVQQIQERDNNNNSNSDNNNNDNNTTPTKMERSMIDVDFVWLLWPLWVTISMKSELNSLA